MKKVLTVILVLIMCVTMTGCGEKQEETDNEFIGMPNPVVDYNSLAQINDLVGVNLIRPGVMGITNERYSIIDNKIAQYNFELNGYEFTFRGANIVDEDISGINDENNVFISKQDATVYTDDFYLERFFDGNKQYTISITDLKDMSKDMFMNCCMEMEDIIKRHLDDPLIGDYMDVVSKRASLTVERTGDIYNIYVEWSSSASELTIWTMQATLQEGKLTYTGENIANITYDSEGNETKEETVTDNIGYFEVNDGQLHWSGAALDYCRESIFEKMEYEN